MGMYSLTSQANISKLKIKSPMLTTNLNVKLAKDRNSVPNCQNKNRSHN